MLKTKHVKASIFQYFATNYGGNVNWESPTRFDPDASSTESWTCLMVDFQEIEPSRSATDFGRIAIELDINSRKRGEMYETESLLDAVRAVLSKGKSIAVKDYDDSDEPTVGWIRLEEPVIRDLTGDDDQWRRARVTIEGRIQEIPSS